MNRQHIENHWYCIPVKSSSYMDMDEPWLWCKKNMKSLDNWTFELANETDFIINYYFESKEDAIRFQLTWG